MTPAFIPQEGYRWGISGATRFNGIGWVIFFNRLIGLQIPFILTSPQNPILMLELKPQKWLAPPTSRQLAQYVRILSLSTPALLILLVIVGIWLDLFTSLLFTLNVVLTVNLTAGFLSDFYYIFHTAHAISAEHETGQWDLLILTGYPIREILRAKYAALQLRAWRVLPAEIGLKLFTAVCFLGAQPLVQILPIIFMLPNATGLLTRVSDMIGWLILGIFVLLEPGWRMRALTAAGLGISSLHQSSLLTLIYASLIVLFSRLMQVILISTALFIYLEGILRPAARDGSAIVAELGFILALISMGALNYVYFRTVRWVGISAALRTLTHGNRAEA